jgi:hypothetical protein
MDALLYALGFRRLPDEVTLASASVSARMSLRISDSPKTFGPGSAP